MPQLAHMRTITRFAYLKLGPAKAYPGPFNCRPEADVLIQYDHQSTVTLLSLFLDHAAHHGGRVLFTFTANQTELNFKLCSKLVVTDGIQWMVGTIREIGNGASPDSPDPQYSTPENLVWRRVSSREKRTRWAYLDDCHALDYFPIDECWSVQFETDRHAAFRYRVKAKSPSCLIGYTRGNL